MKKSLVAVLIAVGGLACAAPAHADWNPYGCTDNSLDVEIGSDLTWVRPGEVEHFTISVANDRGAACDISDAVISINLPGPDGNPSATSTPVATNLDLPHGKPLTVVGTVAWTVTVNPGVVITQATAHGHGLLHRNPQVNIDTGDIAKTLSTVVTRPSMALTKVANPVLGVAPLAVTYTYTLKNTGDADIGNVNVSDSGPGACSPLTYQSGDNGDSILQTTETWVYTCQRVFPNAGTYDNTATACGTATTDRGQVCGGPVSATVTVTQPQPSPGPAPQPVANVVNSPVKPASVAPNTCIESPKSLSLRARELTAVRVTLNDKVKGVKVTVKGPGFTRTGRTNAKGQVTFSVRPTKAGTLTITSTNCAKVSKAVVKAARKTQSRQVPKVTG